jgi:hypothetical protein
VKGLWIAVAVAAMVVAALPETGCSKKSRSDKGASGPATIPASPAPRRTPTLRTRRIPTTTTAPASMPTTQEAAATAPADSRPAVATPTAIQVPTSPEMDEMREKFGLQVTGVVIHANAIEVQFFVSVPDKAGQLLSPTVSRYLIDEKSGTKLVNPTGQPGRERRRLPGLLRPVAGGTGLIRSYIATFDNSEGLVRSGDKVTFVMDEYRVTGLSVQ